MSADQDTPGEDAFARYDGGHEGLTLMMLS